MQQCQIMLCPSSSTGLTNMQLQAISMTMIAYATFDHHDVDLIQAVSAKVLQMPSAFDPQAVANTLWALALLENLSPPVWNCLLVTFVKTAGAAYGNQCVTTGYNSYADSHNSLCITCHPKVTICRTLRPDIIPSRCHTYLQLLSHIFCYQNMFCP